MFSKSFPRTVKGKSLPVWEEVFLTEKDEKIEEQKARKENLFLIKECIEDARSIFKEKKLKNFQSDIVSVAISLFEKMASHHVYWKERKAKEKFDAAP